MKIFKKKGSSFVEVILAMIFLSILTIIIINNANLYVLNLNNKIEGEIKLVLNNYIHVAKSECENMPVGDTSFSQTTGQFMILGNIPVNVTYGCTLENNNLYKISINSVYRKEGYEKNAESYLYKTTP